MASLATWLPMNHRQGYRSRLALTAVVRFTGNRRATPNRRLAFRRETFFASGAPTRGPRAQEGPHENQDLGASGQCRPRTAGRILAGSAALLATAYASFAGLAWLRYGTKERLTRGQELDSLLDLYIPDY